MFDAGVKETLCTRCAHREVCAYKQDFLDIIKAVENAAVTRDTPDGKITSKKVIHYDFISEISVAASTTKIGRKPIVPEKRFFEIARKIHPLL